VQNAVVTRFTRVTAKPVHNLNKNKRKCPCKGVGGTQYGADAAVTHVLLRDPRAATRLLMLAPCSGRCFGAWWVASRRANARYA